MEALWKQASRLKDQVARQGVFKQFGYGNSDNAFTDESEVKLHQRLEKLYLSTRAAKHFQRDIVRGVEGYIVTGSKQVEIGNKLSDDSQKYGVENTCTSGDTLSKAATYFGKARSQMEKERGNMLKAFGTQVHVPNVEFALPSAPNHNEIARLKLFCLKLPTIFPFDLLNADLCCFCKLLMS